MTPLSQVELVEGLRGIVGPDSVSTRHPDRIAYSADFWPKAQLWKKSGEVGRHLPDAIVWPADAQEMSEILRFCNEHEVVVVPFGGGSGVCGGAVPLYGGVTIDVKRIRSVISIDEESQTVHVQAGINGLELEDQLNAVGFTLGHFPPSIMRSTLGGWLATRSAGQFSSRYGKIEDMVLSLRAVLADGTIIDTSERSTGAPDWTQLLVGSEGTLGIIVDAHLKIHRCPESRLLRGWRFKQLTEALTAMRTLMQSGLRPMVLRLYEPFDTLLTLGKQEEEEKEEGLFDALSAGFEFLSDYKMTKASAGALKSIVERFENGAINSALAAPSILNRVLHSLPSPCLLIVGFEGQLDRVQEEMERAGRILADARGTDAGPKPGEHWLKHRYDVSFAQSKVYAAGGFVDAMVVATTWDRLYTLFLAVREAVSPIALVMAHFSHAYEDGCSIYFTFAARSRNPQKALELYDQIWNRALEAVASVGATISHHHGVGIAKRHAMVHEHGEMLRIWRGVKDVLDPKGIMNPGKLFPEGAGSV